MTTRKRRSSIWLIPAMIAIQIPGISGCATLAHRSSTDGHHQRHTSSCTGKGDVCPWLIGDAGLLLLGIVPGVIAFVVDFGTGHWQHDVETSSARLAADDAESP